MCLNINNKGTYTLTFVVNSESLDQAIDILDKMTYKEKLKYIKERTKDDWYKNKHKKNKIQKASR